MPTRKQLLTNLLDEAEKLGDSLDTSAEASDELRCELDSLRIDISDASEHYETVTGQALERLSDRLSDFRGELEATLKEGANSLREGLIEGHLIGSVVGSLVGGVIQNALQRRSTDPHWIMARRIYDALHLITNAYAAGDRLNYDSTLYLLRAHEFKAEQARYVVDLLLRAGALKEYQSDGEATFIMYDPDNEALQALRDGYSRNTLTYLTVGQPPSEVRDEDDS